MSVFLSSQLDFIFFFYGLAFIFLGTRIIRALPGPAAATPIIALTARMGIDGTARYLGH